MMNHDASERFPFPDAPFASIENIIAYDPGGRNVFGLVIPDQLRLAAQSLIGARRVGVVSGLFLPHVGKSETDGPPGAVAVAAALTELGVAADCLTDVRNVEAFRVLGVEPVTNADDYIARAKPTHFVSVERLGRTRDGAYRNMKGEDVTAWHDPLDALFLEADRKDVTTIGIGDGGNEIGMGRVFAEVLATIPHGERIACTVSTDFCIAAGTSNWGAYGLVAALSILSGRDLLPSAYEVANALTTLVQRGVAVDGVTGKSEATVDGIPLATTLRLVENLRRQITPSPLQRREPLCVGVLGYGETGRAAAALLLRRGHRVRVSEVRPLRVEDIPGSKTLDAVETGGHTIEFLAPCDLVVASPGVRPDAPIRNALHRRGVPVMSELELAYQMCDRPIIAVTGTVGKRSTVELLDRLFAAVGRPLTIGGNKGTPLSAILLQEKQTGPIALAVSSFQLETVVTFHPRIAAILNINEAHMDRHCSLAEYIRIKSRVYMNHTSAERLSNVDDPLPCPDTLILPYDDPRLCSLSRKNRGRTCYFSRGRPVTRGAWIERGALYMNMNDHTHLGALSPDSPDGEPLFVENALCAVLIARLSGFDDTEIREALKKNQIDTMS